MISDILGYLGDSANWSGSKGIPILVLQHVVFCLVALVIAALIAVPLGLYVGHTGRGGVLLVGAGNVFHALPTLGLVTLLYLLFLENSIGKELAAVIGLVILAIPPILAGTYAGVSEAERGVVDAAQGMGMTGSQWLWQVELPISLPLLLGGVRNAMLQLVATTAVAAYIGLGGLGRLLLDGLAINDYTEVVVGAIAVAVLAVVLDLALAGLQRVVVPRGVRLSVRASKGKIVKPAEQKASAGAVVAGGGA